MRPARTFHGFAPLRFLPDGRQRAACRAGLRRALLMLLCLLTFSQSGCINTFVMVGKVLMGDPMQTSGFELATKTNLKKEQKRVLVHISAPATISEGYDTLTSDVEEELLRRMRRHELIVVHPDKAARTFDRLGGTFDAQALARDVEDMDVLFHVRIENFSYMEDSSPNFYRGNTHGRIVGYEIREDEGRRYAVQVFDQRFHATYPTTYPVAVDTTPQNVFIRRFIDHVADALGASFYNVSRSDLYAN
jgi:hypothetical protein